jgi:hypothetical protein
MQSKVSVRDAIEVVQQLTPDEQRELVARLWPEPEELGTERSRWSYLKLDGPWRVVSFSPDQEPYLDEVRDLLQHGVLARLDSAEDGYYELYGPTRTYYVAVSLTHQFAGLLQSWPPDHPPRLVSLRDCRADPTPRVGDVASGGRRNQ